MKDEHKIFAHGLPQEVAPGLWQVEGSLPFPVKRNMTVHRLADGTLLLYSVVAMNEEGMKALERLGKPAVMVVPLSSHTMDAAFYKRRYPELRVFAAPDVAKKLGGAVAVDGGPDALRELGIRHHQVPGLKHTELHLDLDVGDGRALVVCDLLGLGGRGLLSRVLGPPKGGGIARAAKWGLIRDKGEVRDYLRALDTTGLRLIASAHSAPVLEDPAGLLARAASQLG